MESSSHHLVHSLTAHMALYHSHSVNPTNPCRSPRSSVIRWFSSLSPAHRQAVVTILDPSFLLILLQMQYRIRCLGHSHFLLLPDLPSISSSPSLSFRPSRGLLSRYAASNSSAQILSSSMLFFCSSSSGANAADAITLSESLVADVDRFVGVMDGLSRGRFLCDDVELLGSTVQWMELPWLKDMGYYSLEAFVANRLELALRLAWISSQVGKKPKEKKVREKAAKVAGNAANAFWRMKSCGDWWIGLDPGKRKVIVSAFFGKAANTLLAGQ